MENQYLQEAPQVTTGDSGESSSKRASALCLSQSVGRMTRMGEGALHGHLKDIAKRIKGKPQTGGKYLKNTHLIKGQSQDISRILN